MKELVEVIAKSWVENPDEVVVTQKEKAQWNAGGIAPAQNFYHQTGSWDGKTYKALNSSELTPNLWVAFSHDKQTEIVLKDDFYVDDEGVLIINTEVH